MSKFVNPTKVITGVNTRWSYVNAWEPKSINGGAPKYSVSLIIRSLIPRRSRRSGLPFRRRMRKARASLKVTASLYLPFRY